MLFQSVEGSVANPARTSYGTIHILRNHYYGKGDQRYVEKCPKVSKNDLKRSINGLKMSKKVQKGPNRSRKVQKGPKRSKNVQKGPKMSKNVYKGPNRSRKVQKCAYVIYGCPL